MNPLNIKVDKYANMRIKLVKYVLICNTFICIKICIYMPDKLGKGTSLIISDNGFRVFLQNIPKETRMHLYVSAEPY